MPMPMQYAWSIIGKLKRDTFKKWYDYFKVLASLLFYSTEISLSLLHKSNFYKWHNWSNVRFGKFEHKYLLGNSLEATILSSLILTNRALLLLLHNQLATPWFHIWPDSFFVLHTSNSIIIVKLYGVEEQEGLFLLVLLLHSVFHSICSTLLEGALK